MDHGHLLPLEAGRGKGCPGASEVLTLMPLGELRQDIFANFIVKSLSSATFKCRDQSFKLKSLHPDKSCQLFGSYRTM